MGISSSKIVITQQQTLRCLKKLKQIVGTCCKLEHDNRQGLGKVHEQGQQARSALHYKVWTPRQWTISAALVCVIGQSTSQDRGPRMAAQNTNHLTMCSHP